MLIASLVTSVASTSALTYQSSNDVEFTFNPTISVSLSDANLIIDNLTPGSSSDSNVITVEVATNAGYGYYMTATAGTKTTNTNLTSTTSSNLFTNVSTDAATLNDLAANSWGYSYSKDNGTTWISGDTNNPSSGYNGLPLDNDDSGATGIILANTDSFTNSSSIKFKIGAKASPTQATGTYTNTINFYAVTNPEPQLGPEPCEAGKICYHVNSLTQTEGSMGKQSQDDNSNAIADNSTVTLLASNFSRTGYGFAGWSDKFDYATNAEAKFYGPMETITTPTGTSTNGLSLYAVWIKSQGSIQDQSKVASVCNSLTTTPTDGTANLTSISALTDQRDNNTYAIAKLADGNCWMIENLRLESTADHNSDGTLAQGYGTSSTYGNFGGLADAESTGFSTTYTANSLYYSGTQEGTASINIGTSDYPAYRMPRYNNINTSTRASSPTNNSGNMYSYGNYYTWHAAIADLTYNGTNNSSVANTSLCPSGWHLPTGGAAYASGNTGGVNVTGDASTFREIYNLGYKTMDEVKTAYEDAPNNGYACYSANTTNTAGKTATAAIRSFPNNFLYSGYFNTSSASNRGSGGNYWSSTAYNNSNSYFLYLGGPSVFPGTNYSSKNSGQSIRCTVGT